MSFNRIQKLILSEYCDFEDVVLVESPFAQTDREGKGLRQVNLGLTPTKLIMAADVANGNKRNGCRIFRDLDPDIVDFELISVFPLQYAHVSIFHRRRKCTIKVKFCTNKVWYFELGGTEKRQTLWRTWCDRINHINRNDQNSASETSAGSSSTTSTISHTNNFLNVKRKPSVNKENNKGQIWCTFNKNGCNVKPKTCKKWTDKYLFIGHSFEESPMDYTPVVYFPTKCELLCSHKTERGDYSKICDCDNIEFCVSKFPHQINRFGCGMAEEKRSKPSSDITQEITFRVNRFGQGIDEKCLPGLYLPTESFMKVKKLHQTISKIDEEPIKPDPGFTKAIANIYNIVEEAVRIWESLQSKRNSQISKTKHERKYALQPNPNISQTFGIWNVRSGERYSIKIKRNVSEVNLLKHNPIRPKLSISFSTESLDTQHRLKITQGVLPFWIHRSHYYGWESSKKSKSKYNEAPPSNFYVNNQSTGKETIVLYKCASSEWNNNINSDESCMSSRKPSVKDLTRILRMELNLTAWDFDSGTLVYQLTLIDRDLFLRIDTEDVTSLIFHESIENSPNLKSFVAFSHRLACLVATEILRNDSAKTRARMIARLINTANGCKRIANFESCGSILNGLQLPAIYRLKRTWTHLRKSHPTQYQIFYDLRSTELQKKFLKIEKTAPYFLPYAGYFIPLLLGKVPGNETPNEEISSTNSTNTTNSCLSTTMISTNIVARLFSAIRILKCPVEEVKKSIETSQNKNNIERKQLIDNKSKRLLRGLKILQMYRHAAGNYRIKRNKVVRDYLLRAKYNDEFQLFKTSLIIEN